MSRIGKLPVEVPGGVNVSVTDTTITAEGPKGRLVQDYRNEVQIVVDGNQVVVTRKNDSKPARSYHGLYRQLVQNMVTGVSAGYTKKLVVNGVGYRAEVNGSVLTLNLGYSTQIEYLIPEGIDIVCETPTLIAVSGISKERVGQVSAEIRSLRKPEPYKGKGIRYADEQIRRKVGKSGAK